MLQVDTRIGNTRRYILTDKEIPLMRVPWEMRKCVLFVGQQDNNGNIIPRGTAFLISRCLTGSSYYFQYTVTAKHVIDRIRDRGGVDVYLRLNNADGKAQWVAHSINNWSFHPDDQEVDVAVAATYPTHDIDQMVYPLESCATDRVIKESQIGPGDEVFITGLFVNHYGQQKNIPIIRTGHIAAMPEEKVETRFGLIDAYLIETISMGGLSGSPVFVHLGPERRVDDNVMRSRRAEGAVFLLGLMHGHYELNSSREDSAQDAYLQESRINAGIGIVVPVSKIIETVNHPDLIKRDREMLAELRRRDYPVTD